MPHATANGIQIEYDTPGDSPFSALLLVMGAGGQMIYRDFEFCELLAKSGLFVIRFDNRDSGQSMKFEDAGIPEKRGCSYPWLPEIVDCIHQGSDSRNPWGCGPAHGAGRRKGNSSTGAGGKIIDRSWNGA